MDINFDIEKVANNQISIDEIGHCCIKATNDKSAGDLTIERTSYSFTLTQGQTEFSFTGSNYYDLIVYEITRY